MSEIHLVSWDWKSDPDFDEIDEHVYSMSSRGLTVRILAVLTHDNDDDIVYAVCTDDATVEEIQAAYLKHYCEDNPDCDDEDSNGIAQDYSESAE